MIMRHRFRVELLRGRRVRKTGLKFSCLECHDFYFAAMLHIGQGSDGLSLVLVSEQLNFEPLNFEHAVRHEESHSMANSHRGALGR